MAASTSPSLLTVRISGRFSANFSLEVDFEVPSGFTMLLGPSGSGKTTTLDSIAGLIRPDSGRIAINSHVLFDSSIGTDAPARTRRLGYLSQNLALFPHLTVRQNIEYGIHKLSPGERVQRTRAPVDSFRIASLMHVRPDVLSGGERQRVALARSLVTNPEALLLDEPLTALDNATKANVLQDLRAWNEAHRIPIIYVTHSPEEAFALGEQVVIIEAGRVIARGLPQQVLRAPSHEAIAQLAGFENIFDATVTAIHEHEGTMVCSIGRGRDLEVPLTRVAFGAPVQIAVRAGDIMVAAEPPHGLSARNCLEGRIVEIKIQGVTAIMSVDSGVIFKVTLTPGACEALDLKPNKTVWLVIKTYSCHLLVRRQASSA